MGIKEKFGSMTDMFEKAKQKYNNMNIDELKQKAKEKGIFGSDDKGEDELKDDLAKSESPESSNQ